MSDVVFAPQDGPELVVSVAERGALLDLCDAANAPVPFACRGATCGSCAVAVLAGGELLAPPGPSERELLLTFAPSSWDVRLACRAEVQAGPGRLVLRPLAPFTETLRRG